MISARNRKERMVTIGVSIVIAWVLWMAKTSGVGHLVASARVP